MAMLISLTLIISGIAQTVDFDLGGQTVTISSNMNNFSTDINLMERIAEAEEMFNCTIVHNHIGWGDISQSFMTRILSGESTYDIVTMGNRHFWPLLSQGYVYPAGMVISEEYFEQLPRLERKMVDGLFTHMGIKFALGSLRDPVEDLHFVLWNKDLFAREGLPDLFELYEAGEWTWEKMTEIVTEATRDTSGDGEIDQWGMTDDYNAIHLGIANDARVTKEKDGRVVFGFDDENALAAIDQWREWFELGVIEPNYGRLQAFKDGNVALTFARMFQFPKDMEEDYGVVPLPMGPNADGYRYPAWEAVTTYVLPINVENAEALAAIVQHINTDPYHEETISDAIQGVVRDPDSMQVLLDARDNWDGEAYALSGIAGLPWGSSSIIQAVQAAIRGEKSAAAAMAEVRPVIQAKLDDTFGE